MEAPLRLAGRITDWNDDRGYGFVAPNGGGDRAFVHINAFQRGSRRPSDGDLISYLPAKDSHGRLQAREIRFSGQRVETPRSPSRIPRTALGTSALVFVVAAAALRLTPIYLSAAYVLLSCVTYVMYWIDKAAAESGARRTPESNLHLFSLLGGWPGALVAQQRFRHKTIKQPFQAVFWVTVAANLASVAWLVVSGNAATLFTSAGS